MTFIGFLSSILGPIIRPIIQEELENFKSWVVDQWMRREAYQKYDDEAQALMEEMANASTSEERYAILQKLRNARALLND